MVIYQPDGAALRAAQMAELMHRPTSEAAQRLTENPLGITLAAEESSSGPRKRRRNAKASNNLKASIAALLHDLLKAAPNLGSDGYCFRPERSPDLTGTLAAFRQYESVRDAWVRVGLMERVPGIRYGLEFDGAYTGGKGKGKARGRAPRLRATPKLLAIAAEHGITPDTLKDNFERSYDSDYSMVLRRKLAGASGRGPRGKSKETTRFVRTDESNRIAVEINAFNALNAHNAFLAGQTFDPPMAPRLVAIFAEDPTRPGELA